MPNPQYWTPRPTLELFRWMMFIALSRVIMMV